MFDLLSSCRLIRKEYLGREGDRDVSVSLAIDNFVNLAGITSRHECHISISNHHSNYHIFCLAHQNTGEPGLVSYANTSDEGGQLVIKPVLLF